MNRSRNGFLAASAAAVLATWAIPAQAATCQDELDRFERRLHGSDLATRDPDTFEQLVRQSEEAAEFRDEEQCLALVAELNAALPDDSGMQPTTDARGEDDGASANPRRPAAPVLLIAEGDDAGTPPADSDSDSDSEDDDD